MDHHFNTEVAKTYGVGEAIILHNICFWQKKNIANNSNFHDGKYWVYNSISAYTELFPYYSDRQIRTILKKLEDKGCVFVGRYNKMKIDRTKWYSASDEIMAIHGIKPNDTKSQMQLHKNVNAITQNGQCNDINTSMHLSDVSHGTAQNDKPIPYKKTDKKTDKTKVIVYPSFDEFKEYALEKEKELDFKIDLVKLKIKFLAWSGNDWKNGYDKKIKNWKSTLTNGLPYLKSDNNTDVNPSSNNAGVKTPKVVDFQLEKHKEHDKRIREAANQPPPNFVYGSQFRAMNEDNN